MASSSATRNAQGRGTSVPKPPSLRINPQVAINHEEPILEEPQANRAKNQDNNREEEYYGNPQEPQRSIADYMTPEFNIHISIYVPPMENVNFHVHPTILTLVQNSQYSGLPSEDPNAHITRFIRACGMYRQEGVSEEIVRLKLFPFSVIGEAARWLESQDDNHLKSWQQLHREFMNKVFPNTKTMRIRRLIQVI
ncbi:hypothetical protein ABN254_21345, partial [Providencia rettgeri]